MHKLDHNTTDADKRLQKSTFFIEHVTNSKIDWTQIKFIINIVRSK